jgi:phospholipase/carboxylesterase
VTPVPIRVFIPRAPDRLAPGYTWLPTYVRSGQLDLFTSSLAAMASRLAEAIRTFVEIRPTLGKPIVVGFSQGGHLAWALAVLHPDVVGTAFPFAGWLPVGLVPDHLLDGVVYPTIHAMHGTEDYPVPIEPTRETARALVDRGLSVDLVEIDGAGHEMTPAMDARFHAWLVDALGGAPSPTSVPEAAPGSPPVSSPEP